MLTTNAPGLEDNAEAFALSFSVPTTAG